MPRVMTPGHEEEIMSLIRFPLVAKRYCSWRPELVLLSAFWHTVPDLGLPGCCTDRCVDPGDVIAVLYQ